VRLLPDIVAASAMPTAQETGRRIPFGIDEDTLAPVVIDFEADPHFVIFGDNECGKTNLVQLISDGIAQRYTPDEARMVFIDYRRGLIDAAGTEHRIGYAAASTAAAGLLKDIKEALEVRLPPADLSPEDLRTRSWWEGSDVFIIVDDYELVATQSGNPLAPIVEFLPQARDIGLHLVVSRAMGGAGRALYDPVLQRLKEMASPALMMSGNREEGALFGDVRPKALVNGRGQFVERRRGTALVQTALLGR
jgi:S-DNA-T family DNA segregation ATPase FtsK/SpoIIIE